MGKWLCKNCETINDDELLICEVCDSISPRVYDFTCDCSDISCLSPCKWSTNVIDSLWMQIGEAEKFEVTKNEIELNIKKNTIVRFYASNNIADRVFEFPIIIKKPSIDCFEVLNAPLYKDEKVKLKWSVKSAETCSINTITAPIKGTDDFVYSNEFQIIARNSSGTVKKTLSIDTLPFPSVTFKSNKSKLKTTDTEGVTLNWNVKQALSAKLLVGDKTIDVKLRDSITLYPTETTSYYLSIIGLDGKRIFEKVLIIEVYPEATCTFNVDFEKVHVNTPFSLFWNTQNAKSVSLNGKSVEACGKKLIKEGISKDATYTLSIEDEFGITNKAIVVKVVPSPSVSITASKTKLHKGRNESVTLTWGVQNATNITLLQNDQEVDKKCGYDDSYKCTVKETTTFTIKAIALDGKSVFTDSVTVEVHPEAKFTFESDKEYAFPKIPFTLSWTTKHAKRVELNGKKVADNGTEIIKKGVDKDTTYTLAVTDEFGTKESSITIKMLPVPRIKTILVPTPQIEQKIAMTVDLQIPDVHLNIPFVQDPIKPKNVIDTNTPKQVKVPIFGIWDKIINFKTNFNRRNHEQ